MRSHTINPIQRGWPWLALLATLLVQGGCGTWVGNPKGDDDDGDDPTPSNVASTGGGGGGVSSQTQNSLGLGQVLMQKVTLKAGQAFASKATFGGAALAGNSVEGSGPLELQLVDALGKEVAFDRDARSDASLDYTPIADGNYTVLVKNNSSWSGLVEALTAQGAQSASSAERADQRTDAPHKDITLKAVIALARTCKAFADGGARVETTTAAEGSYFVQGFVFLGKVGADSKVTPLTTATIQLKSGDKVQSLSRISSLPTTALSDYELPKNADVIRTFYQGYFGAAGELYTVDTFLFGGNCAAAPQFALGSDVGKADLQLVVKDESVTPAIDASFPIRATVAPAFSMYTAAGEKLQDYTQCTSDRITGKPKTYNGDASTCKTFSLTNPPYVTLDYKMPSETTAGLSVVSDPTRILYYGHAYPKAWYEKLIEQQTGLLNGTVKSLTLPGCLNNGGLLAVPISTEKTYMPLAEFNSSTGDVVNLARRAGSYTALTGFYQGNVDASGELNHTTCVPDSQSACAQTKTITVKLEKCTQKADSGISVSSVSESFIYPSYFEMSGIIAE